MTEATQNSTFNYYLFIGAAGAAESYFLPRTMCMWPLFKGSKKFLKFEPAAILVIVVISDFFGYPAQHVGYQLPAQGSNPYSLQGKCRVLTTDHHGNPLTVYSKDQIKFYLASFGGGLVAVMSDSCNPMGCSPPGSSSMGFSRQEYWNGWPFPCPSFKLI